MGKNKMKMSSYFVAAMEYIAAATRVDEKRKNGYKIKNKKEVRKLCCHMIMKNNGSGGSVPEVMIEQDDLNNTAHCLICDRNMVMPDINSDYLNELKRCREIVDGALVLLPWSNISKSDAELAMNTRNMLEKFIILYEAAVDDISTIKVQDTETSMKSHVSRL